MGKKFVGLGGLKHFWTKAKTWIAGQITAEVTAKIAEIVANAPEDLDTLKEIADWISTHANDASAMNTQINTNKNDIAALQTSVAGKSDTGHTHDDRYYTESEVDKKLAGKSNVEHTHTKSEITDFAHTHDDRYFTETEVTSKLAGKSDTGHKHSASDITSGVLPVAKGGTGVTTQADINKAFIRNLEVGASGVTDGTEFVSSYASNNGFAENATPYRRKFSTVWNYIKGKISSVLGLTKDTYGGKASTAESANYLFYTHSNEINFKGGAPGLCYFNYRNADTEGLSPVNTMEYRFCNYSGDTSKSVLMAGSFDGTTAKASSKMVIPIGAPSQLEEGCIWIER